MASTSPHPPRWLVLGPWLLTLGVAGCGPAAGEIELVVDLRTDLRPGLDFDSVRTTLRIEGGGERTSSEPAVVGERDLANDARVAELRDLPSGAARLRVELFGERGQRIASRTLELRLRRSRLVTVVIRGERDEPDGAGSDPPILGPATSAEAVVATGSDAGVDGAAGLDAGASDAGSSMSCGHAVSDGATIGVCRADRSPSVDGHLDEYVGATPVRIDLPGASAVVRLLWDCERLYVAGEVVDRQLWATHTGDDDANLWNTDSLELLLDVAHDATDRPNGDDRHIIVTPTGSLWDARGDGTGWDAELDLPGIEQQARVEGTLDDFEPDEGWRVELAIPFDALGISACPSVGARLGADVALNQERRIEASGDRQWLSEDWAGLESYANPDGWKDLVLLDASGAP